MDKMEFTLGNTQDEAPRRVEKKPVNKKLLFGILAAVVLIAVLAAVLWDPNSFDGLRRRVIYAQAQKDENGCARLYDYAADRTSAYASLDGSLLIASAGQLRLVGENGSVRYETGLRFQSCAVARGGKTAAVYDVGGTEVYVLDSAGLVRQFEVPGPLFSLTVNEKDYIAATFNGSGYKGTVTVYDDKGAEVFTYHSAEWFAGRPLRHGGDPGPGGRQLCQPPGDLPAQRHRAGERDGAHRQRRAGRGRHGPRLLRRGGGRPPLPLRLRRGGGRVRLLRRLPAPVRPGGRRLRRRAAGPPGPSGW